MEYSKLQVKIIVTSCLLGLLAIVISLPLVADKIKFAYGIFFGTGISALMFLQTANALAKASAMAPSQAQKHVTSRYIIRMTIYAMVLFVSIKADNINVIATVIGFLTVKIAVLFLSIFKKI